MIDLQQASYLEQEERYLKQLLQGLTKDPGAWVTTINQNQGRIKEILTHGKPLLRRWVVEKSLARLHLEELQLQAQKSSRLNKFLLAVEAASDTLSLLSVIHLFKDALLDPSSAEEIEKLILPLLRYPDEIKLLKELEVQLLSLEKEWENKNTFRDPLKETKGLYHRMQDELISQLKKDFGDLETAEFLKSNLQRDEFRLPFPRPGILRQLVERTLAALQLPENLSRKLTVIKPALVNYIHAEQEKINHKMEKEIDKLTGYIQERLGEIAQSNAALADDIDTRFNIFDEFVRFLDINAEELLSSQGVLFSLERERDESRLNTVVSAYLAKQKELSSASEKSLSRIKTLNGVALNREAIAEDALASALK